MTDIDDMAAEIVRLRKDRQWKDISTAPKDGTQFLASHPDWYCPAVVYYCLDADRFAFAEDDLADRVGGEAFALDGCYWVVLPPPPEKEET